MNAKEDNSLSEKNRILNESNNSHSDENETLFDNIGHMILGYFLIFSILILIFLLLYLFRNNKK